ncbi:MAG: GNAT family N-acetyltransferase [Acholeplasmatales bacterium]|jgi:ribosomal protein S18 acetylase RimI-like enzyme|nr:GNAT family N-acetyltransferase [Acholeplasmataceae bacterium]MDY0115840.1 GNAT family N-acetyltransferase [Acholeplasmatales bacterium]MCK9234391.1 GNAT family N-acetyltransferase [Acholeplasmataceae bacterium]MCK9289559.1 GNAT family N-acetyltransferase [Acholeplasmataceae bacterium]MCK9427611.1 GNAT family N-acetyltransferase [Acholeplasmataceae bacterium]
MADLIVNLYQKDFLKESNVKLKNEAIKIKRVLSPNADAVVSFVGKHFSQGWASEVKAALYKDNPSCFIATLEGEIIGFACYDATSKGYFGPTGIDPEYRGLNVGQILLLTTLEAMKAFGYGYAIIGGVSEKVEGFYAKYVDFLKSTAKPDLYNRLINR